MKIKFLMTVIFLLNTSLINAIEIKLDEIKKKENIMTEFITNDIKVGEGREAEKGLTVTVHYTGWIYDVNVSGKKGNKFDSSKDRGEPFTFVLGVGQVIKGWDQGFAGMKIGGSRTIIIPSDMGYGSRGAGNVIPPNADLIFDVELLGIQ
ncbi:FKBP-type peptidyl-prolyl cis-trans isomerase [Methylophilaceae bacterium]|jgi:FKBP-type peptidyl-prolyl cis-trans isomerase FkpA|uniref:Peptidyl-prolyl cis-trans isomerase n=1 Tax=Methylophilales bacterium HTCC2181 TaxID=383631 RepID=A0P823_9PROT|nr:FKBP-type peptidyl-prolyl cis-trans isomerase (PPIase) [Methylophilales bacterium HTCC2181]MBT3513371.1 FKBP-type peptidyl-prolyl cis-trans isomerase [Nitrosomonadales bacterium]MDC0115416.1 FKBP-type peptidyl-prolyl cis-trans isomerase [Methylophilaceae bacterium]MBT5411327.1 FKBP-type peptidyl-prolyl cis-trans isomerase [Nitrosomonadales bacterium]MBT6140969.1 FKBP-type peptidyl-prolyl cis-trans isomerase [Nitrosomonadales bacterium]|tara:strand:+ start:506 stop:955 length:450 start_codon:yes stop_codon:yes gene_type:complete